MQEAPVTPKSTDSFETVEREQELDSKMPTPLDLIATSATTATTTAATPKATPASCVEAERKHEIKHGDPPSEQELQLQPVEWIDTFIRVDELEGVRDLLGGIVQRMEQHCQQHYKDFVRGRGAQHKQEMRQSFTKLFGLLHKQALRAGLAPNSFSWPDTVWKIQCQFQMYVSPKAESEWQLVGQQPFPLTPSEEHARRRAQHAQTPRKVPRVHYRDGHFFLTCCGVNRCDEWRASNGKSSDPLTYDELVKHFGKHLKGQDA